MNKKEARKALESYLKERNIEYQKGMDGEAFIYLCLSGYERCPDKSLEVSVYFFDTCLEYRVYFTESTSKWIENAQEASDLADVYRLLNFLNAGVWPATQDGIGGRLYPSSYSHVPRFYITEDGHSDLTATGVCDYDCLALAPLETFDFVTAALPALMDTLSLPIFMTLTQKISVEDAIGMIKREVLQEED